MDFRRAWTVVVVVVVAVVAVLAAGIPSTASAKKPPKPPLVHELATFAAHGSGSTIGPDKALYVTDGPGGQVLRVDPKTGDVTTFASGLPPSILPFGGAMDVEFIGHTAYVLVSVVGPDVGGSDTVGIYRVDGPNSVTVVADIGAFALSKPPKTLLQGDVPTGVQYALEKYRGGFLVTDGNHNRVLRVRRNGDVSEFRAFDNIVPTGLAVRGNKVYMAEAGPVPHEPADGKVVSFRPKSSTVTEVASGAPLLVDVEFGRGRTLYALSQGVFGGGPPASPASPNTGSLVKVSRNGTFTVVPGTGGLDRPTSLEFIGNTAFVITLTGKVIRIDDVGRPPFGKSH